MKNFISFLIVFGLIFSIQALVINEFLASNDTIMPDEWGEFDDWLELYNASSSAVDLSGYNLSDNPLILDKWQFPAGTMIGAGGYLIVWIDDDEETQGPLHASFKLSADGDNIIISDGSLNIIDEFSFGIQTTDISMGRYPNGTGDFIFMTPTPGLSNLSGVPISHDEIPQAAIKLSNYPNPFNPTTTISFSLTAKDAEGAKLEIYNLKGQKIKTFSNLQITKSPNQQIIWNGTDTNIQPVSSGIYFYKLNIEHSPVKKMLLLK
ncbi:MAG: lamin tail domain-containing protein [Candidatus Cloacimonadales bacterium]|nr:lamin tail domain-containing protein [Candidatus Cloacimonadales bacterium]